MRGNKLVTNNDWNNNELILNALRVLSEYFKIVSLSLIAITE